MAFKLKDLMISLLPQAGRVCPTASAPACPTASAPDAFACPTATAFDARLCPTASAGLCVAASAPVVFCPTVSAPVLVMPGTPRFCPTASAFDPRFCPTASAGLACPTASAPEAAAACPTASAPAPEAMSLDGLATLKQQLQQALAQVEEQERALAASHLPQTLEEADELEARLHEALAELRQHKEDLKK